MTKRDNTDNSREKGRFFFKIYNIVHTEYILLHKTRITSATGGLYRNCIQIFAGMKGRVSERPYLYAH